MMNRNSTALPIHLIPLVVGLLFAAGMLFLAVISTEKARNHYKSQETEASIRKMMRSINPGNVQPPVKEKHWFVKYEVQLLLYALPLIIIGLHLTSMAIGSGRLPERNPLGLSDSMRRSLLLMVCSFILSPAMLLTYIWALRVGLIG